MSEGIVYQNKDIEFKLLSESFKEKSFAAYGLQIPRIKEVLPTNLPEVSANEMRMDNLFLLEDDTYALVDYESDNRIEDRIKYLNYISRVMERYYKENHEVTMIRMIVLYTGDVENAKDIFNAGCITLRMEQVFVRNLLSEKIYQTIQRKLKRNEPLTEEELMQLIILPLAEKGTKNKQKRVEQVIELAKKISNEKEQRFVLSGLLVMSDKFIDRKSAEAIRRALSMTKVGRMLFEDGMREGRESGLKEGMRKMAEKLLRRGDDLATIMELTDLSEEEIKDIEKNMLVLQ